MGTMLVGLLIVAAGAAGFGLALFGRRPVPQTAMPLGAPLRGEPAHAGSDHAELEPPEPRGAATVAVAARSLAPRNLMQDTGDVALTRWTRIRAALLLALTVVGLAALIGGLLSILVVGLVLFVT